MYRSIYRSSWCRKQSFNIEDCISAYNETQEERPLTPTIKVLMFVTPKRLKWPQEQRAQRGLHSICCLEWSQLPSFTTSIAPRQGQGRLHSGIRSRAQTASTTLGCYHVRGQTLTHSEEDYRTIETPVRGSTKLKYQHSIYAFSKIRTSTTGVKASNILTGDFR